MRRESRLAPPLCKKSKLCAKIGKLVMFLSLSSIAAITGTGKYSTTDLAQLVLDCIFPSTKKASSRIRETLMLMLHKENLPLSTTWISEQDWFCKNVTVHAITDTLGETDEALLMEIKFNVSSQPCNSNSWTCLFWKEHAQLPQAATSLNPYSYLAPCSAHTRWHEEPGRTNYENPRQSHFIFYSFIKMSTFRKCFRHTDVTCILLIISNKVRNWSQKSGEIFHSSNHSITTTLSLLILLLYLPSA